MKKAVVLLSGGIDSATTLFCAKKKKFKCFCLTFDYGQKHKKEIKSARRIAKVCGFPFFVVKLDIPKQASALTNYKKRISAAKMEDIGKKIPSTYVPARNIIFLSMALSWAETNNCSRIFIGANMIDYSGYPDCRPDFLRAFQKMARLGTKRGVENKAVEVEAPLLFKTKAQIIKMAKQLGVPFELTWSCYRGSKVPCNNCESCLLRAKGFEAAGVTDPVAR